MGTEAIVSNAAFEAAAWAAVDVFAKWLHTANRDAYVDVMVGQCAREGVQAAAPLIVADELERLVNTAFPDEDSDYYYGLEALLGAVHERIIELRGEAGE